MNDHKINFVTKYCIGKSALDIGCVMHDPKRYTSPYWLHGAIEKVAFELVGIDIDREGIKYLQNIGYNIIYADAQNFFLNRTFDVIVAGDVLEHLENFDGFFKCCKNHMHENSILLISTPNPWHWINIIRSAFYYDFHVNREHVCYFSMRTLKQLLARYNFEIKDIKFGARGIWRFIPLPNGWKHTSFHVMAQTMKDHIIDKALQ